MKKRHFILSVTILLIVWYIAGILLNKSILPSPFKVLLHTFFILDKLLIHVLYSLLRIISGIFIGIVLGWPIGILSGYFKKIDDILSPMIYLIYPIPKIALLPILMLLLGLGEITKIVIIVIIILFQIIVTIRDSIKEMDEKIYYPLNVLGSSNKDIIIHIVIPSTLPKLFSAIRISLGTSIAVLFFSETFGTTYGLGYFIMDSLVRINYPDMYAGIIVLSTIGLFIFSLVDFLQSKVVKWQ